MRPPEVAVAALLLVAAAAVAAAAAAAESAAPLPAALRLQRAVPHQGVPLEELRRRDAARHRVSRRRLLGGVAGVVDFPVEGSANPYMVGWVSCRLRFPLCCLVVV
jgi:kinase